MTQPTKTASFTMLRSGDWGVRGRDLKPGDTIKIVRQDGSIKLGTVGKIRWTSPTGIQLATLSWVSDEPWAMPKRTPITRAKLFNLACADRRYSIETRMGDVRFDVLQRHKGSGHILLGVRCYTTGVCIRIDIPADRALNMTCREAALLLGLIPKE